MGLRHGSLGAGEWAFPGGSVEPGEAPEMAAVRELYEETGLIVRQVSRLPVWSNDLFPEHNKHFVTLYFVARVTSDQEPVIAEPDKCLEWQWFDPRATPKPRFAGTDDVLPSVLPFTL
jgi:8-oxo-dGTP diphosphatase